VRLEIEAALSRGVPVFVALAGSAARPLPEALPPSLAALSERPALPLRSDPEFAEDLAGLLQALRAAPPAPARSLRAGERWTEVRLAAARGAAIGALVGLSTALALALALRGAPRDLLGFAAKAPLPLCGAAVGWRAIRSPGAMRGLHHGTQTALAIVVLFNVCGGFVLLLLVVPVLRDPKLINSLFSDLSLMAGGTAAATGGLLTGLKVAATARRPFRTAILCCLPGAVLGGGIVVALAMVALHARHGGPPPAWLENSLYSVSLQTAAAAVGGVALGAQTGWRRRER
jgi:hypothetical protein